MNKVLFLGLIIGAFYAVHRHGVGTAFAWFYIPAILLVNFAKAVNLPGIPNLATATAVGYGVIMGLCFRPEELRKIRWNFLDTLVVLMIIPTFISVMNSKDGSAWLGYREAAEYAFRWVVPYLIARIALQDPIGRVRMLKSLCYCAILIGALAAFESRLKPNSTARFLNKLQLDETSNRMVMGRFGLARAIATAGQPIDLGNCGVLIGGLILVLTPAAGRSWKDPLPIAGILGAGAMAFCCISFTAWFACGLAIAFYCLLALPGIGRYLVVPILLVEIAGMTTISYKWLQETISQERPEDQMEASKWIRVRIIQDAWPSCVTAGWFGAGKDLDTSGIAVGSIDNSYLLFIMRTGWVSLASWVLFALIVAAKGSSILAKARTPSERYPAAAALAGFLAILFAMYTVFFGFAYAIMFSILVGIINTMWQMYCTAGAPVTNVGYGGAPAYAIPAGGYR